MNRESPDAEEIVDESAGIFSSVDRPEEDVEVDRIVMKLASEKIKDAVENEY